MTAGTEYMRIHWAARKVIGVACVRCGTTSRLQAALRVDVNPNNLKHDSLSGCMYSTDTGDYCALCIPCHRKQDLVDARPYCRNGHEYTPENTSVKPDGARRCLTCHREQNKVRLSTHEARTKKTQQDREYRAKHPMTAEQKVRKMELQRLRRAKNRSTQMERPR